MSVARIASLSRAIPPRQLAAVSILHKFGAREMSTNTNPSSKLPYTKQQEQKGRPVSPHLEIFAFPQTAITSILVRITGVTLAGGMAALSGLTLSGYDPVAFMYAVQDYPIVLPFAKFAVTFPLTYHYACAIRHYYWDNNPAALTNEGVKQSDYYVVGSVAAVVLAALVA